MTKQEQTRAGARQIDFYGAEATRECTARGPNRLGQGHGSSILRYGNDMRVHL